MPFLHPAHLREMRALAVGDAMLVPINGRHQHRLRTELASAARAHRDAGHDFDWILSQAPGWIVLERVAHDMPISDRVARVAHWRGFARPREVRVAAVKCAG